MPEQRPGATGAVDRGTHDAAGIARPFADGPDVFEAFGKTRLAIAWNPQRARTARLDANQQALFAGIARQLSIETPNS